MKKAKFKKELRRLNFDQLREKLENLRKGLFGLQLNSTTAHVKDYSQFKKFRRQIASVLTLMHQK